MNAHAPDARPEAYGDDRYFTRLAAAFVRGRLETLPPGMTEGELIEAGLAAGLRLHKFKRNSELPRVRRVLGVLRAIGPSSLLDVGSGRGTFLWPLLDSFTDLDVTAVDLNPVRVTDIDCVRAGGVANLRARQMDATRLDFADDSFEVVTALEVLEHLEAPERAAAEALRVAARFVVASVPSKEDDNPEHVRLFDRHGFESLLLSAGARAVKVEFVLNHMIAVARV